MMEVAGSVAAADHMLFYSVCQATFYVMCFRGDELAGATATAAAASVAAAAGGGGGNGSGGGGDFERQVRSVRVGGAGFGWGGGLVGWGGVGWDGCGWLGCKFRLSVSWVQSICSVTECRITISSRPSSAPAPFCFLVSFGM